MGRYIKLANLLPEVLREVQFDHSKYSKGKYTEGKEDEKKKWRFTITSTLDWTVAFTTYMVVAVHVQPQWAFALATNMSIVTGLARQVKGQAWACYD